MEGSEKKIDEQMKEVMEEQEDWELPDESEQDIDECDSCSA